MLMLLSAIQICSNIRVEYLLNYCIKEVLKIAAGLSGWVMSSKIYSVMKTHEVLIKWIGFS